MNRFSPINSKLPALWHGGDYNLEQWPRETWREDMDLMDEAGVNVVTLGVFSWVTLEPEDGRYDFAWLDEAFELLHQRRKHVILATPSAAPPAWMSAKYPEILRTGANRVRRLHGNRVNYCWTSPVYRAQVRRIVTELARRYGNHPALVLWHVSNEYGGECYCELCRQAFVKWLQAKFGGDLDKLNAAYWTRFWGHTYSTWDEIEIPGEPLGETAVQGLSLDWRRFTTDQIVDFMVQEAAPLREITPEMPIATNMMGVYDGLNPWKVAPNVDLISWDSYPEFARQPMGWDNWASVALRHDLNRSLKNKPFLLMETSPSSSNWYSAMTLKPPKRHLFEGMQAIAHGSEGVLYFQWRQSRGGQEKFHGAVVSHGYTNDSRVFGEVKLVGEALKGMDEVLGAPSPADVALIYDWEADWALKGSCGPVQGNKGYYGTAVDWYKPFWESGITVDILSSECDFSGYKLVVAPMLYILKPGVAERIRAFVESGGMFVTTYLSGYADENDLIFESGYLGPLRDVFGIRVEEIDALPEALNRRIDTVGGLGGSYVASRFCELVHLDGATPLAVYGDGFYAGRPAATTHRFGRGQAVYVGSRNETSFQRHLISRLVTELGIEKCMDWSLPEGVIVRSRGDFLFVMNCKDEPATFEIEAGLVDVLTDETATTRLNLEAFGTRIFIRQPFGGKARERTATVAG